MKYARRIMLCPCCGEELPLENWPSTGVLPTPRVRKATTVSGWRALSQTQRHKGRIEWHHRCFQTKEKEHSLWFFCTAFLLQCIYLNDVEIIQKFRRLRWQMFLTSMFGTAATAFKWFMVCVPRDFCHLHTIEPSSVLSTSLRGRFLKRKGKKCK